MTFITTKAIKSESNHQCQFMLVKYRVGLFAEAQMPRSHLYILKLNPHFFPDAHFNVILMRVQVNSP